MISLAALRWLADQHAAFIMLDRDGSVLATTGPVFPSDARLRRAQGRADQSGTALQIVQELITQKIAGQERVVREKLGNSTVAKTVSDIRVAIASAQTIEAVRLLESLAGGAYWGAWRGLTIAFPRNDLRRVPKHWLEF